MSTTRTRHDDDEDDERAHRLLRDGERMRVPTFLMDGVQIAVSDAYGQGGLALSRPGPRFASGLTQDAETKRAELYEFADAERAAAWRGGLQVGDRVDLAGKRFTVERRDADGSTKLALDRKSAEELKEAAYAAADAEQSAAWRGSDAENSVRQEGDACVTKDGKKGRVVRRNMALSCEPISTDSMSLDQLAEQRRVATSDAYAEYDEYAANAWRSK